MNLIALSKILIAAALFLSILIGYQIWITPIAYKSIRVSGSYNGIKNENEILEFKNFSDVSALGVIPLLAPVVITLLTLWATFKSKHYIQVFLTFLMLFLWYITGFSIGMTYTPVVILVILGLVINLIGKWFFARFLS